MDEHHLSSNTDLIAASAPAAIASTRQHTRDPRMMPLCKFDARRFLSFQQSRFDVARRVIQLSRAHVAGSSS